MSLITSITRPNGTSRTINYDNDGEITDIVERAASKAPIAFFTLNWANTGRVTWEFSAPLPHTNAPPTRTNTFDNDNRLKTVDGLNVTEDANGNMTYGPLLNDSFTNYTYDVQNRLLNAGGINYGYDPAGNRTFITNGASVARFVVNPNTALPQTLMRIQNGVTNYYIYGPGLLYQVTATPSGESTLTYHYDSRGSTVALTDGNGNVTDRMEYGVYGITTLRGGTNDTPFLYNGQYGVMTDANGLLYMRARYYNPYICRFINPDPSGFSAGLNWYAYAGGDPVGGTDPSGLGTVNTDQLASWIVNNSNPNPSTTPADTSNPFALSSATLQQNMQPVIVCHGVSAGGFNGDVNSFSGLTAIPGSGPNAMQGYQTLENLSVAAAPLVAGPVGGVIGNSLDAAVGTTSVFWSGWGSQAAAETWAAANGSQTLSMSPFAVGSEATPQAVQSASTSFASAASGNVQVFQPAAGVPVNSVWSGFEYPTLLQNQNVSTITFQIIDNSGNVIKTISVPVH